MGMKDSYNNTDIWDSNSSHIVGRASFFLDPHLFLNTSFWFTQTTVLCVKESAYATVWSFWNLKKKPGMFPYTLQDPWWNLPGHTAVNNQEFPMDTELGKLMNLSSLG